MFGAYQRSVTSCLVLLKPGFPCTVNNNIATDITVSQFLSVIF